MATPRYTSRTNVFIPGGGKSQEATLEVISYTRSPEEFPLPNYVQYVDAPLPVGIYLQLDTDQPVRIQNEAKFYWQDRAPRPEGNSNDGNFVEKSYRTKRRSYDWILGQQEQENAIWKLRESNIGITASQAMTNRTSVVSTLLNTTGNWPTGHTADCNTINGGFGPWDTASNDDINATSTFLAIKKSIMAAVRKITIDTNGKVQFKDLVLVMGPDVAIAISETPEYHTYVEKSIFAASQLRGDNPNLNMKWGIGTRLYGVETVVEDSVISTANPTNLGTPDANKSFIWPKDQAALISKKGGLDGQYGNPSFSTVQLMIHENMTVESFASARDRRTEGFVTDDFDAVPTAFLSGFLFTDCLSGS